MAAPTLNYTYPGRILLSGLSWSIGLQNMPAAQLKGRSTHLAIFNIYLRALSTHMLMNILDRRSSNFAQQQAMFTTPAKRLRITGVRSMRAFVTFPTPYFARTSTRPPYGEQWPRFAQYGSTQ